LIWFRNHGAVPKLSWETHEIVVRGLGLRGERRMGMAELAGLPSRTLPVTLVCAGNRRKEMNLVRQSKGFNWGPAAVSTSQWTGVPLHELLRHCGLDAGACGALWERWVNFNGPAAELAKGKYGTSITLAKALDPSADVLIAYKQNGEYLTPDHGFPVRIIIPG
jgi:nitrate reductase (NAD(P)H)